MTTSVETQRRPTVAARNVNKFFGGVRALADVSVAVYPGEVLALVGDNGAGKSTFTRILSGADVADGGEVFYEDVLVRNPNPRTAQRFGIEVVPQHLALCDNLSAAMNIVLGRPPLKWSIGGFGIVDRKRAETIARDELREVGATIADVNSPIRRMSGGQRQAIAIARALLRGGKMIIFDEPTAALGVRQRQTTLNLIRQLADRGLATLMISHNIDDVFAIADRVIAFRQGRVVLNSTVEATSRDAVHLAMEGLSDG